ncbi:MAG: hypothetical protein JWO13_1589 [Acidobacteriales bacterium]|nr:hypothetical protein [Terriglobales bacterium]
MTKQQKREVVNGFRLVGGIFLGCFLIGSLVVGFGETFGTIRDSNLSSLTRPGAFAVALCSFAAIALTVQRWAKYFAGWVGFGVLNSLIIASSGHALNNPSIHVGCGFALSMALVWLTSSITSLRFTNGKELNLLDKSALLSWVLAFAMFANLALANKPELALAMLSLGSLGLVIAWFFHRYHRGYLAVGAI